MKRLLGLMHPGRAVAMATLMLVLAAPALPVYAQDTLAEARIRKMEAEIRALQRQVFPGGSGKIFAPEITPAAPGTSAVSASTPVSDILTRMDSLEAQIARLTAQAEENANKLKLIETRLGPVAPAPETVAATPATPTPAADANLAAMAGGAATVKPAVVTTPVAAATPKPAAIAAPAPKPAASAAAAAKPAASTGPSNQRLTAVRAIVKPQTDDPGDDEYSYGYRLWEAKFLPEAQQQLKLYINKYPRHVRVSHARNLLGRAYLDEGNTDEAGRWFVANYNANKAGERAADSLLYLAETMRQRKDTNRACIALAEFADTYPREAAGRLKPMYDATRGAVKCN